MNAWWSQNTLLLLCLLGGVVVTLLPKVLPVTLLRGDSLPPLAMMASEAQVAVVMAALVGPDVFFYEGRFSAGPSNLFLMAALPSVLVAWWGKNYFLTIAFGLALVIAARWLGFY